MSGDSGRRGEGGGQGGGGLPGAELSEVEQSRVLQSCWPQGAAGRMVGGQKGWPLASALTGTPGPVFSLPSLVQRACVSLSLLARTPLFQEAFQVAPADFCRLVSPALPCHTHHAHALMVSCMNFGTHFYV